MLRKLQNRALLVGPRRYRTSMSSRAPFSAMSEAAKFQPGDVVHGFTVDEVSRIDEMDLEAVRLTHSSTGARYLHFRRDDSNNVFSINFRTIPKDSTGLPHVLEHTVLCGSERYPCRDPFIKMLRRSLATFLNAMTGADCTLYLLSTQNPKDFRNLQSVYLDTVFRPSLRELDFRQEGWRLEHADVNDKNSPIVFKGVVFNEMKGVFNENQVLLTQKLMNTILPSHAYAHCSGGDPLVIPEMTHEALVNFHARHYHPSNARFYSYGNFPLEKHLEFINDRYLRESGAMDTGSTIVPPEVRWKAPKRQHVACRPDPMAADQCRQSSIAIGQLCNDIGDLQGTFELHVLSQLLLKGPNSALYESLVESKLGTGFGPSTGFESEMRDTIFVMTLQGVRSEDFGKIEATYDETLKRVIYEGFSKDHVEGVLHRIELSVKDQASNFGVDLLFKLSALWNHDGDILTAMRINDSVKRLTARLDADPAYLNKLVKLYLLDNTHRLTLTMSPEESFDSRRIAAEQKLLKDKLADLNPEELTKIYESGQSLLADQKKDEPEVLPTLTIEDLKPDVERYETRDTVVSGVPVQLSIQPTNGIAYYRGILSTMELREDLKKLLPIFNLVVAKMGTEINNYRSFDRLCQLKTGGLTFSNHVAETKDSDDRYEEGILFQSYCLDKNANDMWRLWEELFIGAKLEDVKCFENLVKGMAGNLVNGIAYSGHVYAMSSAMSLISVSSRLKESLSGLEFIGRMKNLAQSKDFAGLLEKIREIQEEVLHKGKLRSAINLSAENTDEIVEGMNEFYGGLIGSSGGSRLITQGEKNIGDRDESAVHHVMPWSVNYCSKAVETVPYTDPEYAVLRILAKLVTNLYLFPELREKGGAYGAEANLLMDGVFTFYSYRDPNSTRTLDVFDGTYEFLQRYAFSQKDIDEAKLGLFQQIDAPVPPANRGMNKFLYELTDDDLQEQRLRLRAVTREQMLQTAEKYLKPGKAGLKIGRALLGPANEDLKRRSSEGWDVLDQDEENRARAC